MKKIINLSYGILLGIGLILFVALVGVKLVGVSPYVVTSGSMTPKYPVGSMIYVQKTDTELIKEGDAITFYMGNNKTVATHQVYEIDEEKELFYTQGINNLDSEGNIIHDSEPVPFKQVIGKPVFCVPYLGTIFRECLNPPGIYIVLGLVIVYCLALSIVEKTFIKEEEK